MVNMAMQLPSKDVRFSHTPLGYKKKEIRLSTIQQDSDPSSPIHITLETVDFGAHVEVFVNRNEHVTKVRAEWEDTPLAESQRIDELIEAAKRKSDDPNILNFAALSYTWGPETPVHDIYVTSQHNQGWFSVRANLFEFLKMRRQLASSAFWIDQICIDQGNTDEKTHQVNQMAEIYTYASVVEAWLGPRFEGSDVLMDIFAHIGRFSYNLESGKRAQKWKEKLVANRTPFERFSKLPYWSRLWIVQGLVLGENITIWLGNKSLLWQHWVRGWKRFAEHSVSKHENSARGPVSEVYMLGEQLSWLRSLRGQRGKLTWWNFPDMVVNLKCLDPRDRVFGILGMVDPGVRFHSDYSMKPQDILLKMLTLEVEARSIRDSHLSDARIDKPCISVARLYSPVLEDKQNRINPAAVRRHLLKILPDAVLFNHRFRWDWQLNLYLWCHLPNPHNLGWWLLNRTLFEWRHRVWTKVSPWMRQVRDDLRRPNPRIPN